MHCFSSKFHQISSLMMHDATKTQSSHFLPSLMVPSIVLSFSKSMGRTILSSVPKGLCLKFVFHNFHKFICLSTLFLHLIPACLYFHTHHASPHFSNLQKGSKRKSVFWLMTWRKGPEGEGSEGFTNWQVKEAS